MRNKRCALTETLEEYLQQPKQKKRGRPRHKSLSWSEVQYYRNKYKLDEFGKPTAETRKVIKKILEEET